METIDYIFIKSSKLRMAGEQSDFLEFVRKFKYLQEIFLLSDSKKVSAVDDDHYMLYLDRRLALQTMRANDMRICMPFVNFRQIKRVSKTVFAKMLDMPSTISHDLVHDKERAILHNDIMTIDVLSDDFANEFKGFCESKKRKEEYKRSKKGLLVQSLKIAGTGALLGLGFQLAKHMVGGTEMEVWTPPDDLYFVGEFDILSANEQDGEDIQCICRPSRNILL